MNTTILDTTAWLNFARAEAIQTLIRFMSGRCAVGLLVQRHELLRWPKGTARESQPFSFEPFLETGALELAVMTPGEMAQFYANKSKYHLGDGETEALVIAISRNWRVATDDGAARKKFAAHKPTVDLTGTIGLLRELVAASAIKKAEAARLLELMRNRGGRVPHEKF